VSSSERAKSRRPVSKSARFKWVRAGLIPAARRPHLDIERRVKLGYFDASGLNVVLRVKDHLMREITCREEHRIVELQRYHRSLKARACRRKISPSSGSSVSRVPKRALEMRFSSPLRPPSPQVRLAIARRDILLTHSWP